MYICIYAYVYVYYVYVYYVYVSYVYSVYVYYVNVYSVYVYYIMYIETGKRPITATIPTHYFLSQSDIVIEVKILYMCVPTVQQHPPCSVGLYMG